MNRRMVLTGMLGAFEIIKQQSKGYRFTSRPTASLGYGLEIRDYRLFPTDDVMRFIVEVHNTTDQPVDTPLLGLILDHMPSGQDSGFAMPASAILHPHTSGALFGVAPSGLKNDGEWGSPEWVLCDELHTWRTEELEEIDVTYTHDIIYSRVDHAQVVITVENHGDQAVGMGTFRFEGVVYDSANRICGIILPLEPWRIEKEERNNYVAHLGPSFDYIGNPFVLIESTDGISVELSVQPRYRYVSPSCPGSFTL